MNYTLEVSHALGEGWFVQVKELRGCMSQGDTAEEAIAMIQEAMELWLGVSLDDGDPPPVPACYVCKVCYQPIEVTIEGELICSECRAIRDLDADSLVSLDEDGELVWEDAEQVFPIAL